MSASGGGKPGECRVPPNTRQVTKKPVPSRTASIWMYVLHGFVENEKVSHFLLCLLVSSESEFYRFTNHLQTPPVRKAPCEEGLVFVKMNRLRIFGFLDGVTL